MKELYVVRHAKSSWDDPYLKDFDRPLNKRGKRNVPAMGKRLAAFNLQTDLLISSPANRALTTAKGIAKSLDYEKNRIQKEMDLYHASTNTIRAVIAQVPEEINSLMIFGHNPGLTSFINSMSDYYLDNLPTCAICGIRFQADSWARAMDQRGEKFYYDFPKSVLN